LSMDPERKRTNMKHGAIIGAAVGVAIFVMAFTMNPSWMHLIYIPIAAAMGWGIQYTRVDDPDD